MVCGQLVCEDFESGLGDNWIESVQGRWETDSLTAGSGKFSLHHCYDNPAQGCDQAGLMINDLQPEMSETVWSFKVRHAYNPSSSNNWSFFLMSDRPPGEMRAGSMVSGFALGVNLSGYNDSLCLWKIVDGRASAVFSTSVNWQNDIGLDSLASLTVKRAVGGIWNVFIYDGEQQLNIGSGTDSDLFYAGWAGIMYEYSSSQDRKLWLDDIIIDGYAQKDTRPPAVDTVFFADNENIFLAFDEMPANDPAVQNFILMPGNNVPAGINRVGDGQYLLEYEQALENKTYYSLQVGGVCDMSANCCDTIIDSILLAYPEWGDIIISEIMFDPDPPVALPALEYLEIRNLSEFRFNTGTLELQAGDNRHEPAAGHISPGEYIIISCEDDTEVFSNYGKTIPSTTKFSLNNSSERLLLRNKTGAVLHGLEYDTDWYNNQLKKEGGWSLEMIDSKCPFAGRINWSVSSDRRGGTPGEENSVSRDNPDLDDPFLVNIYPVHARSLHLDFSETMDRQVSATGNWSVGGNAIVSTDPGDPLIRSIDIELADSLQPGLVYELSASAGIADQAGNPLNINDGRFGIAEMTGTNDLIFNEILFDPLPGLSGFIELYNPSDKIIDLSDHLVVSYDKERQDTGRIVWLSEERRCLMPGDYYVITTDREALISAYSSCNAYRIFELDILPSMPSREGSLILFNRSLILLDEMSYSGDMHFSMLSVTSGVSLERLDHDKPGTDISNWCSAAGTAGYATPGMKNSALAGEDNKKGTTVMSLSSKKISPDNDGFEDQLRISIETPGEQNILTITVFDDMGYPVRRLADNITSHRRSVSIWDGCDDTGQPVRDGIYIIFAQMVSRGQVPEIMKKVCAVVR